MPRSKPPRLIVPRSSAGLSPCRSLKATRKKSAPPGPTTLFAPTRVHRRRSDEPCGTRPPDAAAHPLLASSADARTSSPMRTYPTVPEWFFGSPYRTTASASRIPGACASPGRSPLAASASQTNVLSAPDRHRGRCKEEGLGFEPSFRIADQHPAHGHGEQARGVPLVGGAHRITVEAPGRDPLPVASLQGLVDADDE